MALDTAGIAAVYRRRARHYDITANLYYLMGFREWAYRKKAVRSLKLRPGDTVVEIGAGTGLNFELLEAEIGPTGRIIGVDLTEAMLERAARRVAAHRWRNVELVHADAAAYDFPRGVAGIISTFALTLVPRYDAVIRRGATALKPGGRWVIADLKLPDGWTRHWLPLLLPLFRPFAVTADLAARRPWDSLAQHLESASVEESYFGYTYVAVGER